MLSLILLLQHLIGAELPVLRTIEKPEEKRVFFEIGAKLPRDGEERGVLTADMEHAEALLAKHNYEQKHGVSLLRFHKDPLAGGFVAAGKIMHHKALWVGEWL